MQIHMHDVKAHIARQGLAENGIEIGTVVVEQTAGLVHDRGNLRNLPFEHTESGRVGEHDAGRLRPNARTQPVQIDIAVRTCRYFHDIATAHSGRSRIGAMRRIGNDDLGAFMIATRAR